MTPPSQDRTGLPERLELLRTEIVLDGTRLTVGHEDGPSLAVAAELVRRYNSHETMRKAIERAIDSFEGCGCDCSPLTRIDGYPDIPAHTCLPCELRAALSAGIGQGE